MSPTVFLAGLLAGAVACCCSLVRPLRRNEPDATADEWRDAFVNALPLGVVGMDVEGAVTYWNSEAESIFGWTAAEVTGRPVPFVLKERWHLLQADLRAPRRWPPGQRKVAVRKDGRRIDIAVWAAPAPDAINGNTVVLALFDDITHRRRQEQRLQESEQRYRDLFENARDVVCTVDMDLNFTSMNRAGVECSGYSREEFLTMNVADIISPEDMEVVRDAVRRRLEALQTGAAVPDPTFRLGFKLKEGRFIYADARPRIAMEDGRPVGFHVVVRDITDQKRWEDELEKKNRELAEALDAARQATEVKSRFLANMSHEIRTPMNGVIATSELLAETSLHTAQQEYVDMIRSSAQSLLRVINDILDISKIEAGKLELISAPFDIEALVADVDCVLGIQAAVKGLRLTSKTDPAVPRHLRGDAVRLRQVLLNLAGNAVKFTDEGGVDIRVSLESESSADAVLRFSVRDSGIGISKGDSENLFRSFVQADSSPARRYGGTGLGLAISKQLVDLMGGSVGLESEPGCGSTFWFTARFEKGYGADEPADEVGPAPTPKTFPGTAVLVAEDNTMNRTIATRMLERLGCSVEAVTDGRQAVEAVSRRTYDVIFMDGQMPVLDGLSATAEIRRAESGSRHTPIIAVTASAMVGDRECCLAAGMDDYITKPLSLASVASVLDRWVPSKTPAR